MLFCRDIELNKIVEKIIFNTSDYLRKNLKSAPSSIILTGSFARGEGSIYRLDDKIIVLGDIEFLIYFQKPTRNIEKTLEELSINYSDYLKNRDIECTIDFGFMTDAFFSRAKSTIFAIELLETGKILWGDKDLLKRRLNNIKKEAYLDFLKNIKLKNCFLNYILIEWFIIIQH